MNWISLFWWAWNHLGFIPMTVCTIHRFFFPDPKAAFFPLDTVAKFLMFPAVIYYVLDSISIIVQYQRFGWCNFGYLGHHLITLTAFKDMMCLSYYPWFLIIPFTMHCVLLMFPEVSFFNTIYFFLMVNCIVRLCREPWKSRERYYWVGKIMCAVMFGPCMVLYLNKCKNTMNNVD